MNLIEKYKISRFKSMLGCLKKYDQELEIYSSILEIEENGTTFLNGNTWSGYLESDEYSFSVKNTSTDKIFQITKGDKEVTLTLRKWSEYFYRQLTTKIITRKTITDNNIVQIINTETEKKMLQDGIECINSKEFSRECFVIGDGEKEVALDSEYIEKSKTAIRETDGTIFIDEKEIKGDNQSRCTYIMQGISIIAEDIVSIPDDEKIEVNPNLFDDYMQGNISDIEELVKGKIYQKKA